MHIFKRWIINHLLKKPAPERIPRSGKRAENVDCNVIYFHATDESWTFYCTDINDRGLEGRYWSKRNSDENGEYEERTLTFEELKNANVEIHRFYKLYTFEYHSFASYALNSLFRLERIQILIGSVKKYIFTKKSLVLSERIEALKILLDCHLNDRNFSITGMGLTLLVNSNFWVFHPDKSKQVRYNYLLLESLELTGDLKKQGNSEYKLTPQALITISEYEAEQNRHKEAITQSKAITWLTCVIVVIGLVQAGISLYDFFSSDSFFVNWEAILIHIKR